MENGKHGAPVMVLPAKPADEWRKTALTTQQQQRVLFGKGLFTDCKIVAKDEVFKAHKLLLSRASSEFARLFYGELNVDVVNLSLVASSNAVYWMLEFIYTDELNPTARSATSPPDTLCELYLLAERFNVFALSRDALAAIKQKLSVCSVWRVLSFVLHQGSAPGTAVLTDLCCSILQSSSEAALSSPEFNFADSCAVLTAVTSDTLTVSELTLIEACVRWGRHECRRRQLSECDQNVREMLGPAVMSRLRFLTLTPEQFAKGPATQDWLSLAEKASIVFSLVAPDKFCLEPGLCAIRTPRTAARAPRPEESSGETEEEVPSPKPIFGMYS